MRQGESSTPGSHRGFSQKIGANSEICSRLVERQILWMET